MCACGRPLVQPRELAEEVNKHERQRRDLDETEEEGGLAQEGRDMSGWPLAMSPSLLMSPKEVRTSVMRRLVHEEWACSQLEV